MSNTFGNILRLTTYGESHGVAVGGILDGMPSGYKIDIAAIQAALDRRRPGQSVITTSRREADRVEILSGLMDGVTTGTPIAFEVRNADHHSSDYDNMAHTFRPSHADYTYTARYGIRDHRGGGRSSARETLARVAAGAIAAQALAEHGIDIYAYTRQVGDIALTEQYTAYDPALIESNIVRCPDKSTAERMIALIEQVKAEGDTIGGVVECVIKGCPAGLGDPVFGKLHAMLGAAMLGINAAKGFDYGMGFDGVGLRGSEAMDPFEVDPATGRISFAANHSGGIQGGISNGADIYFRVAFKPVATLLREVATINDSGESVTLRARGRHDPCVVSRAVPIVEAMAALTILDAMLGARCARR
ncbi:MAG: chorismate synthase [Candidatus Amulumruptor sp.]|nr:chorismate synthase [Candidatus Amulumruptor sp.]